MTPPPALLDAWDLRVTGDLGGRLNQHWQVRDGTERATLRRWHGPEAEVQYELGILSLIDGTGLDLPTLRRGPWSMDGVWWSLHGFVSGDPAPREEARTRGRWLAELHARWRDLPLPHPRPGWSDLQAVLNEPATDALLNAHEATNPADVRLYRWHLHRARAALTGLHFSARPQTLIHGDFTPWNLRVQSGVWTGLLDFEFARPADPIEEFALAWRGLHDDVVHGYAEHTPLTDEDFALLTPLWWAHLLSPALHDLGRGVRDDGWTARKLCVRSPLMGDLAAPYPG
ncbi:phosphotransferase enzyme family protein [Deinococcus frigens]|uniref:phosphotransferase enzyme family protein n=1 Tax=Deinococcus frigens TaxID=249403 RepID=UPI00068B5873|nr:aminoglycoside phosphotransferase family protein [Deinococcus frigens]